ncbi:MAG TPA: YlbF family regulator [Limnochordales bacterium]
MAPAGEGGISREIEQRARALGEALTADPRVERYRKARQAVREREATRIMLRDLRSREAELWRRRAAGEQVSPEEWDRLRQLAQVVGYNPYVRELWEAEEEMAQLLAQVMAVVQEAAGLAEGEEEEPEPGEAGGQASQAPSGAGGGASPSAAAGTDAQGRRAPAAAAPGSGGPLHVARTKLWVPGRP